MKICYVDESGHGGKKYNPHQPVEVLCGVITDITKLFKTQRQHNDFLYLLSSHRINVDEFKASELYGGRNDWYGVDASIRDNIFDILLNWSKSRFCKFIVCPIDSKSFYKLKKSNCLFASKFKYPWEAGAFNIVLCVQRENHKKKSNKGKTVIIFDEQPKHDDRFLKLFEQDLAFTDGYTCYSKIKKPKNLPRLDQIIDIPHFSKSHLTVLIQLADIAAYIVNRYICMFIYDFDEKYPGERNKISKWCDLIRKNMVSHTSIDPPGNDDLCKFFSSIRPNNWTARDFVLK